MHIIIDVALCAIVLLFAFISRKKGFLTTFLELCGFILAGFAAIKLSPIVSEWIYDTLIAPSMISSVTDKLSSSAAVAADTVIGAIPAFAVKAAEFIGINVKGIAEGTASSGSFEKIASEVNASVIRPIIVLLIKAILTIIMFVVFMIVIKLIAKLFKGVNKLPLIGGLNKALGFILGIGKGAIVAMLVCFVLYLLISVAGGKFLFFTKDITDKTIIYSWVNSFNPLIK